MKYQINIIHGTRKSKSVTTYETLIDARNINDAYRLYNSERASYEPRLEADILNEYTDLDMLGNSTRAVILPYVDSVANGEAIITLAAQTVRDKRKFMRIGGAAQERAEKELTPQDIEDYTQAAALAIVETLADNPAANMYDCRCRALSSIDSLRYSVNGKRGYNASVDYDPSLAFCNPFANYLPRPTCVAMDDAVKYAMLNCGLSEQERDILIIRANHTYTWDAIADMCKMSLRNVKYLYGKARYKLLLWIVRNDLDTLRNLPICPAYAYYTLRDLAKQGAVKCPFNSLADFIAACK